MVPASIFIEKGGILNFHAIHIIATMKIFTRPDRKIFLISHFHWPQIYIFSYSSNFFRRVITSRQVVRIIFSSSI